MDWPQRPARVLRVDMMNTPVKQPTYSDASTYQQDVSAFDFPSLDELDPSLGKFCIYRG